MSGFNAIRISSEMAHDSYIGIHAYRLTASNTQETQLLLTNRATHLCNMQWRD